MFGFAIAIFRENLLTTLRANHLWAYIALIAGALLWAHPFLFEFYKWITGGNREESPLEISFDPSNPDKKFWSLETYKNQDGSSSSYWECRVQITNASLKTLRNVSVTVERRGPLSERPYDSLFSRNQLPVCDIKPRCWELAAVVRWPQPKKLPGMLSGPSAWVYGPFVITASADDALPITKCFQFNYETDQMLFEDTKSVMP